MISLTNTTLIIPIRIEHSDRHTNAQNTLRFLNKHINTNVYILEVSDDKKSKLP